MAPDGIHVAADVRVDDPEAILALARAQGVDLALIGPEQPLVDGLADTLRAAGVPTVGASSASAVMEGSKAEAKAFMLRHNIPTCLLYTSDAADE